MLLYDIYRMVKWSSFWRKSGRLHTNRTVVLSLGRVVRGICVWFKDPGRVHGDETIIIT